VEDVGRELGVRYVIEGSVRKAGDTVRVTAQLIDATSGHHVWSERYDRELADTFALQTELVDDIMASLPSHIGDAEEQRVSRKPPGDVSAYDAMLRGGAYFRSSTRAGNEQARGWFERALELDPSYADAAAALGVTYLVPYLSLWNLDLAPVERGRELGRRALALDPQSPTANLVLGLAATVTGQRAEAGRFHERAVELDPNFSAGHLALGMDLFHQGRFQEAVSAAGRAVRLDPLGTAAQTLLANALLVSGRIEEAAAIAERERAANPDSIHARLLLAYVYPRQERLAEVRTLVAEVRAINPELTAEQATRLTPSSLREEAIGNMRRLGFP
jgi:adenylate cyclase